MQLKFETKNIKNIKLKTKIANSKLTKREKRKKERKKYNLLFENQLFRY